MLRPRPAAQRKPAAAASVDAERRLEECLARCASAQRSSYKALAVRHRGVVLENALTPSALQGGRRRRALGGRRHAPASGACAVWPRAGVRGAARRAALTASAQGAVCGSAGRQRCARDAAAVVKRSGCSLCGCGSRLARAAAARLDGRRRYPRSPRAVAAQRRLCCCICCRWRVYAARERPKALLSKPGGCFCRCLCAVRAVGGKWCTRTLAGVCICAFNSCRRPNCAAHKRRSPCCPCYCACR